MASSPIEQHSLMKSLTRLADQVIPPLGQLEKLQKAGFSYVGVGLLRVRSRWDVDRDGNVSFGGTVAVKIDASDLASLGTGAPPGELTTAIKGAFERASNVAGGGVFELLFLPLVVPQDQVEKTTQALREVFVALAGREET